MQNEISDIVKDLKTIICIPSVQGKAVEGAPFGKDVAKALEFTLSLAKDMGFETINYDNYIMFRLV